MTPEDLIRLAQKHAICTSADHKEFLHDGLLAFVAEVVAADRAQVVAKLSNRAVAGALLLADVKHVMLDPDAKLPASGERRA